MTRKDYCLIAADFARVAASIGPNTTPQGVLNALAYDLAMTLGQDNPRFDRSRFLAACLTGAAEG